ncbi:dynein axonemal assembly factor 6 isoform X2 [Aquarana catesbeiana]|uniref:dynein axonemal assembly factor 6 isoform X2 n=1 Tax=Aquarana catesbeiana TaxID=8400 RepID=UPI003CCA51C6
MSGGGRGNMEEHLGEFSTTSSIQALCDLLHNPSEEEEEIESHCPSSSAFAAGPGDIGSVKKIQQDISTSETEKDGKDIWHESEVKEGAEFDDFLDPREKPESVSSFLTPRSLMFHLIKLGLHLPHAVNEKSGQAKFMADTGTLELTLPMVRDMDFINFA